ncbi:lipid II flippase MurJ, partial [Bradyrhizobium sp.]|uniref:lipid II flippase MurJ n=1 Tax=Bradyrhizobium sp. TaxID=376 RepID=UPI0025C47833
MNGQTGWRISAIWPYLDEGPDWNVQHGRRCGFLSNNQRIGRDRKRRRDLRIIVPRRPDDARTAQVCLTVAGFEAVYLIWGLFSDRFTVADVQKTATILAYLCLGLSGWAAQTVISRGFYTLESTWLPTIVGTGIAFIMAPVYVVLRRQGRAIGLAITSSTAIIAYVMLGWAAAETFEKGPMPAAPRFRGLRECCGRCSAWPPPLSRRPWAFFARVPLGTTFLIRTS